MTGSSWILGGGHPWYPGMTPAERPRSGADRVVVDDDAGLSLATLPHGPRGLESPDDSLGRLALPRGVAVDGETVLVLSTDGAWVYRYDAVGSTLAPLADVGAEGLRADADAGAFAAPRRFHDATAIAAQDGALYVADPVNRRVQVFDVATVALLRVHADLGDPLDVAAGEDGIYILDRGAGRVYRTSRSRDALSLAVDLPGGDVDARERERARRQGWDRLAVDRAGRIYVRHRTEGTVQLDVFVPAAGAPATAPEERVSDPERVRARFTPPAVTADRGGLLVLPERLLDPCGLRRPVADRATRWEIGDRLYALDAETGSLRVYLPDGRLRHRFGPYDGTGRPVAPDAADAWSPVDVVAVHGCAAVLDARHGTILTHRMGNEELRVSIAAPAGAERSWRRLAADDAGRLLLWDGASDSVDRIDSRGRALGAVALREVRRYFDRPRSTRQPAAAPPRVRLSRDGAVPAPPHEPPRPPEPAYETAGTFTSGWLDGGAYDCAWHVVELDFDDLPPASRVVVRTRTSHERQSAAEVEASLRAGEPSGAWQETQAFGGPTQPEGDGPHRFASDVLVPSGPGRYLQLRVELGGDGAATPRLRSARVRFPRESLLQYLPAIYSAPDEQRDFLDRYLAIPQARWSAIEREVDTFERWLDPDSVPPEGLAYLASWADLTLEGTWTAEQNRRVLQAMPGLRARWGTVEGLRTWIRLHLSNLSGVEEPVLEDAGLPALAEGFVERRRLLLGTEGATLCAPDALWSPSVERRFQVGVFDREGEVELVSTGDPEGDVFARYAHVFRVYVPAAWVRNAAEEALLRRAIDLQRPAHTTYELVLVEPRFRVGLQSTVGLDTVIGGPAPSTLSCPGAGEAPARQPFQRLGHDVVLGGRDGDPPIGLEGSLA